jgi:hypothetical protein
MMKHLRALAAAFAMLAIPAISPAQTVTECPSDLPKYFGS